MGSVQQTVVTSGGLQIATMRKHSLALYYFVESGSEPFKVGVGHSGWGLSLGVHVQQILSFCLCSWEVRSEGSGLPRDLLDKGTWLARLTSQACVCIPGALRRGDVDTQGHWGAQPQRDDRLRTKGEGGLLQARDRGLRRNTC